MAAGGKGPFSHVSLQQQINWLEECWETLLPLPALQFSASYAVKSALLVHSIAESAPQSDRILTSFHFRSKWPPTDDANATSDDADGHQFMAFALGATGDIYIMHYATRRMEPDAEPEYGASCAVEGEADDETPKEPLQWSVAALKVPAEYTLLDASFYGEVVGAPFHNTVDHTPYTIHHTPYTIHHTPYTIHPTPYTIHHTPYTLHLTPYTIHHTPYTIHYTPYLLQLDFVRVLVEYNLAEVVQRQ
jgi:hypothetical protein